MTIAQVAFISLVMSVTQPTISPCPITQLIYTPDLAPRYEVETTTGPETSTEPLETSTDSKTYLGKWRVSEYCSRCNNGGATATASGKTATEFYTCAVSHDNYRKWKGKHLYIEGWGEFEIQDWGSVHGTDKSKWVDLYLPSEYHNEVWQKCKVYLVD